MLALVLGTNAVQAAGVDLPRQPFRVELASSVDCPEASSFAWQLSRRTPRLRPADTAEPALTFSVELRGAAGQFDGRLTLREADGRTTVRELPGGSCAELISALALIGAILVDPDASTQALEPPAPSPGAHTAAPPVAPPGAGGSSPAPPPATSVRERFVPRAPKAWSYGMGFGFSAQHGAAPETLFGIAAELEVLAHRGPLSGGALGLSLEHAKSGQIAVGTGATVEFQWTTGRVAACPLRWPADSRAGFRPCLAFEFGTVTARSSRNVVQIAPWLVPELLLCWELVLGGLIVLGVEGGAGVPLLRGEFFFEPNGPNTNVHTTPRLGLVADGRLGVRF